MPVEQELIEKAVTRNTSAFEELITPHHIQLQKWLSYILDEDAEDRLHRMFSWLFG